MPKLVQSVPVDGPGDRRVRVLFYDDGSIRFRVANAAPMRLSEAFLSGRDANVIVKLDPEIPWQVGAGPTTALDANEQRQEMVALLRDRDEIGVLHRTKQIAEQLRQETLAFAQARLEDSAFRPVQSGNRVESYAPIWKPTLEALGPRMRQYTAAVTTLIEYAPPRVADAVAPLARIFERSLPSGSRAATDLPRLVAALTGQTLLSYATALRNYAAFAAVARPRFNSYRGSRPWVLATEFHHVESLGNDASVVGAVLLEHIKSEDVGEMGITPEDLENAAIAANVLLGVLGCATEDAGRANYCWGVTYYADRIEPTIRELATDGSARTEIASIVGEDADTFAERFVERYVTQLKQASFGSNPLDDRVLRLFGTPT
jgi:hypothetical protein